MKTQFNVIVTIENPESIEEAYHDLEIFCNSKNQFGYTMNDSKFTFEIDGADIPAELLKKS